MEGSGEVWGRLGQAESRAVVVWVVEERMCKWRQDRERKCCYRKGGRERRS